MASTPGTHIDQLGHRDGLHVQLALLELLAALVHAHGNELGLQCVTHAVQ